MPETIKEELIRRLELKDASDSDLDSLIPERRDKLSIPERLHLFTRMALTILRADSHSEPEGETLP